MRPRLLFLLCAGVVACAANPSPLDLASGETGLDGPLDPVPDEGKPDTAGARGPRVRHGTASEVWAVTRAWTDVEDGLSWEQRYDAWIASFERVPRATGWGETFAIATPFGDRTLPAPALECAEVALMLRATFASFHGLPFFVQGWDARRRESIWAGHFGFVDREGRRALGFPSFRTAYRDYTATWTEGTPWPSDARLRGYHLGDDDAVPFVGEDAGAGAYFDELFLNKRVGYFLRLLLLYFGSANLADVANTFHLAPEAIHPGDVLLERWQRRGIGHTIPILRVAETVPGRFAVDVATGSMPRRQPIWEEPARARHYFTLAASGGEGVAADGTPYARLGGGLRRWRTAVERDGRWLGVVLPEDRSVYVDESDEAAVAVRTQTFAEVLADVSPEERRDAALGRIEAARMHLRSVPASCAARTRREDAFDELYAVMEAHFGADRGSVGAAHRLLEDHVLAELAYESAKTCCWNSTTPAMFEIVMDLAEDEQRRAGDAGMCVEPVVFRAERGPDGYARWRAHAETLGRAADWVSWSEDEPCAWRDVPEDTTTGRGASWCAVSARRDPPPEGCDPDGRDDDPARATLLDRPRDARICDDDVDWYRVEGSGGTRVRIAFRHADGDLDIEAVDTAGARIALSNSVTDEELVEATGGFYVRVYGYAGATNTYVISTARLE